jgi:hypothetical protein
MASRSLRDVLDYEIVPLTGEPSKTRAARKRWLRRRYNATALRRRTTRGTVLPFSTSADRRRDATQALFDAKRLVEELGVSAGEIANVAGADPELIRRWIDEGVPLPNPSVVERITRLAAIVGELEDVLERDGIAPWLRTRVPAFGRRTPFEMISHGELQPIHGFIASVNSAPPAG